jgi:hypothetical protein
MGRFIVVTKRKRSAAADRFVVLLVPTLVLAWMLGQGGPGVDGSLQAMERTGPVDLAPGEQLIRSALVGDVWVEAIRSSGPVSLPEDDAFRAALRDRCGQERLAPLLRDGGTALEHRHGPDGRLVYTLRMTHDICDQVRMG